MINVFDELKKNKSKILVIGDVMLDQYYCGNVSRISPESPVPVFNYKSEYHRLGGASNVAANLVELSDLVSIATVIGKDENGKIFKELIKQLNIDDSFIMYDDDRVTTTKTRLLAQNNQQIIRIDNEDTFTISENIKEELLNRIKLNINKFDIVLISDYLKGLLSEEFIQEVIRICNENNKKTIIDIKGKDLNKYQNAYLLKPNKKELEDILNCKIENKKDLISSIIDLKEKANVKSVLVTCGEKGMTLIDENDNIYEIDGIPREVFDVTGAGDTVLSFLGKTISSGVPTYESSKISNMAASIKVSKVGTSIVRIDEIEEYFYKNHCENKKIININQYKNMDFKNSKIVFTNGCFDIIHIGHIRYLKEASKLGDKLIVGVNSDKSVRRIKGEKRPLNNENYRTEMLSNFDFIDYIILFDDETPYELIKEINPDILVKGGDYKIDEIVGKDIVDKKGGKVFSLPFIEDFSTTNIVNKILDSYK